MLANSFDIVDMEKVYEVGAYAYILDQVPYQSFIAMMQMVSVGQRVAPPELLDFIRTAPRAEQSLTQALSPEELGLNEREITILMDLERGLPNKAISRELGISESAVKTAVKAILRKLSVQNRTQAALLAHENGWVGGAGTETRGSKGSRCMSSHPVHGVPSN